MSSSDRNQVRAGKLLYLHMPTYMYMYMSNVYMHMHFDFSSCLTSTAAVLWSGRSGWCSSGHSNQTSSLPANRATHIHVNVYRKLVPECGHTHVTYNVSLD